MTAAMRKLPGFGPRNALSLTDLLGPSVRIQYCDRTTCCPCNAKNSVRLKKRGLQFDLREGKDFGTYFDTYCPS